MYFIWCLSISRYRSELRIQRFLSWLQPAQPHVLSCPSTPNWVLAWLAATSISLECWVLISALSWMLSSGQCPCDLTYMLPPLSLAMSTMSGGMPKAWPTHRPPSHLVCWWLLISIWFSCFFLRSVEASVFSSSLCFCWLTPCFFLTRLFHLV